MTWVASNARQKAQWFDVGLVCGVGALVSYALGVFIPVPLRVEYLAFMAHGPLLTISSVGLFVFLRESRDTVSLQIATLCLLCAGVMFTAMATMQGSIIFQIRDFISQGDGSDVERWRAIFRGTMSTQLGLDYAFDIFISTGVFLVAWNIRSHPRFWRLFGWLGMLVSSIGLAFNTITFPENSGEAGLIDPAPFFGAWFGTLVIVYGLSRAWFRHRLEEAGTVS